MTADSHFGHLVAARARGYETVEEHDRALISNFRKRVQDTDKLWFLGDMAFDGWRARLRAVLPLIPGEHHIVLGNHDRPHPLNSRGHAYQEEFRDLGFRSVSLAARISYEGMGALMSHFPYAGDNGDRKDRFEEWRLPDAGRPLLHGHTHGKEILTHTEKGTPQVHVGLDAWDMFPVHLSDVFAVLRAG